MSIQPEHQTRARTSERAFTMVELTVVGIIGIILVSLAIIAFIGSKSTTYHKEGVAAGTAYAQAVSQFQGDHANRNPTMSGTNTPAVKKGPLNLLNKPYMSIPDSVSSGRVGVSAGANCGAGAANPSGATGAHRSWVSICFEAAPNYGVRVLSRSPDNKWTGPKAKLCWLGRTAKTPKC